MSLHRRTIPALLAGCLLLALAPAAQAERVLVVGGGKPAVWKNDPTVPPSLQQPPRPTTLPAEAGPRARAAVGRGVRARTASRRGRRAVKKALRRARRTKAISKRAHRTYARRYARAKRTRGRLGGTRGAQLGSVIATLERIAMGGRLTASRMPALFLQLLRNTQYWRSKPLLASGDRVSFRGSEMLFEHYPGQGLQIQPLGNFGKANGMISSCLGIFDDVCRPEAIRRLLTELSDIASRRGPWLTWEYFFHFGGGKPPWISGMAQGTAIQALARGGDYLEVPRFTRTARRALGAFKRAAPVGVRTRGPNGGVHYLQYSFNRGLFIANAFAQTVTGLYDFWKLTGDPTARRLWRRGDRGLRREIPHHDIGDWSLYSRGGSESSWEYHDLLRDFLRNLCERIEAPVYCNTAKRFTSYMRDPARLTFDGPARASKGEFTPVRFTVSKRSTVELRVFRNGTNVSTKSATFSRGSWYLGIRPSAGGVYEVRLAAKELRTGKGLVTRDSGEIDVAP
jgi:hypothetical protein